MSKSVCKTNLMVFSLVLAAAFNAQADGQNTIEELKSRIAQDQATLRALQIAQEPTFLNIARERNYQQRDAIAHCSKNGAHLPSVRELAKLSMRLGSKGIAEIESGKPDDSYAEINALNIDGSLDRFYFSKKGYQRPADKLGIQYFWSSSIFRPDHYHGYVLDGDNGGITMKWRGTESGMAIWCATGR